MPLTDLQRMVIRALRPFRQPRDYVGGGVALNQNWPRLSDDMDIFHDERGRLPEGVKPELDALREAGFLVEVTTQTEWMVEAILTQYGYQTRVQWLDDPESCCRFFPAIDDDVLGFRLHQSDVAINKVLCAASRQNAARDAVDLVSIVQNYCPLGPLVWAISGKDERHTPPNILREMRRITFGYADKEIRTVRMEDGSEINQNQLRSVLGPAFDAAEKYCSQIAPPALLGQLFVDINEVPVEASGDDVEQGRVFSKQVKNFAVIPKLQN